MGIISGGFFYKRINNFIFNYLDIDYTAEEFAADFPGIDNPITDGDRWEYLHPMNGKHVTHVRLRDRPAAQARLLQLAFPAQLQRDAHYTFTHSITSGIYNEDGEERTGRLAARHGTPHGQRLAGLGE